MSGRRNPCVCGGWGECDDSCKRPVRRRCRECGAELSAGDKNGICHKCRFHLQHVPYGNTAPGRHACQWKEEEEGAYWETGCGHAFVLIDGTPEENGMRFCPYCGNTLVTEVHHGHGVDRFQGSLPAGEAAP